MGNFVLYTNAPANCLHFVVVVAAVVSTQFNNINSRTCDIICHARIIQINAELSTKLSCAYQFATRR